jgi:5-methylcytosine-specific restriction endonuclease McrA
VSTIGDMHDSVEDELHARGEDAMSSRTDGGRTGTATWKKLRTQAKREAQEAGLVSCPMCGVQLDWSVAGHTNSPEADHIVPWAKGGRDVIENVRIICRQCNQRKGDRMTWAPGREQHSPKPTTTTTLVAW